MAKVIVDFDSTCLFNEELSSSALSLRGIEFELGEQESLVAKRYGELAREFSSEIRVATFPDPTRSSLFYLAILVPPELLSIRDAPLFRFIREFCTQHYDFFARAVGNDPQHFNRATGFPLVLTPKLWNLWYSVYPLKSLTFHSVDAVFRLEIEAPLPTRRMLWESAAVYYRGWLDSRIWWIRESPERERALYEPMLRSMQLHMKLLETGTATVSESAFSQFEPTNDLLEPDDGVGRPDGDVVCRERLGGLLHYYHRKAA